MKKWFRLRCEWQPHTLSYPRQYLTVGSHFSPKRQAIANFVLQPTFTQTCVWRRPLGRTPCRFRQNIMIYLLQKPSSKLTLTCSSQNLCRPYSLGGGKALKLPKALQRINHVNAPTRSLLVLGGKTPAKPGTTASVTAASTVASAMSATSGKVLRLNS